jgi:Flp pilus assembly protein TadG
MLGRLSQSCSLLRGVWLHSRRPRSDGERGSIALWVIIFTFAVIVLVALMVDGGQLMNAKERAADVAEQAARAAANDVSVADLRAGKVAIAPGACAPDGPAASLVASYGQGIGATAVIPAIYRGSQGCTTGTKMTATGPAHFATVTVTVTTVPVIPIGIFGSYQVPATATAVLECGINQGVAC